MLKNINPQNIILTPLVTSKYWNLHNIDNTDLVLVETGSVEEDTVALEYLDYFNYNGSGSVTVNADCSIALEQQEGDFVTFREGKQATGKYREETDETNKDGTSKRLVHNQIKNAFYNSYKNPTSLFGMENIDFVLSKTNRYITNDFLLFNIPSIVFGEHIYPNTVRLSNLSLDDNMIITDDGYGNMIVGNNLFFKIQELRHFANKIQSGTLNIICQPNDADLTWDSTQEFDMADVNWDS